MPEEVLAELPPLTEEDLVNTRTIAHELEFLPGTPAERFASVAQPTLIVASDHTAPEIHTYADALVAAMPAATKAVVPGEWHGVDDATLTEAIVAFSGGAR
ncbi:MAG: hypothetical protein Q4F65_13920 [Propionibacteriaceae bacterium]|nr:hypothetical protein [Propionibacteriaceae bacterium]